MFALKAHQWGDFLGGVFGPLAFLWLVLGYFIQAKELRAQVQATRDLVEPASRHADIAEQTYSRALRAETRAAVPRFIQERQAIPPVSGNDIVIRNIGGEARNVRIRGNDAYNWRIHPSTVPKDSTTSLKPLRQGLTVASPPRVFELIYSDANGKRYRAKCTITPSMEFDVVDTALVED